MDVPPHQRLAPGEPHLGHAEVNEQLREPRGLLVGEDRLLREEMVTLAVHLSGHAVGASEVAPVGDRYAEVVDGPAERVGDRGGHDAAPARAASRISSAMRRAA